MRLEPLPFPFGAGPFRGRGIVFKGYFEYVSRAIPDGARRVLATCRDPRVGEFFTQIFLATAYYDLSPLILLARAAARVEGVRVDQLVRQRARTSADSVVRGLYRNLLTAETGAEMAGRLPRVFARYFDPCHAELEAVDDASLRVRFRGLPAPALGWYVWSNEGFVGRALEIAGAAQPRFRWSTPMDDGALQGVTQQSVELEVRWR